MGIFNLCMDKLFTSYRTISMKNNPSEYNKDDQNSSSSMSKNSQSHQNNSTFDEEMKQFWFKADAFNTLYALNVLLSECDFVRKKFYKELMRTNKKNT